VLNDFFKLWNQRESGSGMASEISDQSRDLHSFRLVKLPVQCLPIPEACPDRPLPEIDKRYIRPSVMDTS
jgi:hypothetical protein